MLRTITHPLRLLRDIASGVLAIAGIAASVLDPKLHSYLREGEKLEGVEMFQIAIVRWLEDDREQLERLEKGQRNALRELKKLTLRRADEEKDLYGKLLRIRQTFEDAFGQGMAVVYLGLDPGMAAVEPLVLRRYARDAMEVLSNPTFATPPPVVEGIWESPLQYAQQIRTSLEPFEATLDEIAAQKKEAEKVRRVRTELLGRVKPRLKWSGRLFEALYHLAGLGYHADRLRSPVGTRSEEPDPAEDPIDVGEPADAGEAEPSTEETDTSPSSA